MLGFLIFTVKFLTGLGFFVLLGWYLFYSIGGAIQEATEGQSGDARWCHMIRSGPIYKFFFWLNSPVKKGQ